MKSKRGFSLMEMLVVVLIIGILTSMALPGYEKASRRAMFVEVEQELITLMKATDAFIMAGGYRTGGIENIQDITIPNCEENGCYTAVGRWNITCTNSYCQIIFDANNSKFSTGCSPRWLWQKSMSDPKWTWKYGLDGAQKACYSEFFHMMCDWWIKQGGRPIDSGIQSIAQEKCGI